MQVVAAESDGYITVLCIAAKFASVQCSVNSFMFEFAHGLASHTWQ